MRCYVRIENGLGNGLGDAMIHKAAIDHTQQDAELLEATASEQLTLEQEYEMQQTWLVDESSMSNMGMVTITLERVTCRNSNHNNHRMHLYLVRPHHTRHTTYWQPWRRCV